jgi:4-hydroxybenzoyl-CoA thioesterase
MFDESTAEMFRAALGLPKINWTRKFGLVGFPMVDTRAKFIIPSFYGDDIVIESRVTEFRSSSFDVAHTVYKGDKVAIEGSETRVMVAADPTRPGGIKSAPIPDEILRAFDKAG